MANPDGIGGQRSDEPGRNPEGKNGHIKGWQRYGTRIQTWLDKTGREMESLTEEEIKDRPLIDIACIQHARDMVTGTPEDRRRARESALDRIEGKPKQTHAVGGDPDNPTPISMDGVFTLTFGTEDNNGTTPTEPAGAKPPGG